jgi:hypothetical protein
MVGVRITGATLVKDAAPRRGRLLVGYFDCELPGIEMKGCALFLLSNGHSFVRPPCIPGPGRNLRAVTVTDPDLRAAMREAATAALRALGARLEWPGATDA